MQPAGGPPRLPVQRAVWRSSPVPGLKPTVAALVPVRLRHPRILMRFIQFIYRNVMRRKVRSLLTGIGVAVAITAVVALLGVANGFARSSKEMLRAVDLLVVRRGLGTNTGRLDEAIGPRLTELPEIDTVTPILNDMVKLPDVGEIPLRGYPPESDALKSLRIQPGGSNLATNDSDSVLLGVFLAKNLKKKVGDTVEIEQKDFKVAGIYEAGSVYENRGVAALLGSLQSLMERPHQVSEFDLVLKRDFTGDQAAVDRVQTAVRAMRDNDGNSAGLDAMTTAQFIDGSNEIRLSGAMAWMTSSIALIIGAVGMLNTMIMSVLERTQEIGILRAIGWKKQRIMRMILGESFTLALGGAIAGVIGAVLLTQLISRIPWAEGLVRPDISWTVIITGFLLALLLGLVGGAYPAFRGASLAPTEALRYE